MYPTWRAGTPSSDIALVYLKKAVRGVKPTPLYKADDEGGQAVVIVGHGAADGKARAAINTIDRVSPKVLTLLVKKPDEASDLQGSLSLGDRGGPAYLQEKDDLFVAGIAIGPDESDGNAQLYTRVSAFVPWMQEAFDKAAKAELRDQFEAPGN